MGADIIGQFYDVGATLAALGALYGLWIVARKFGKGQSGAKALEIAGAANAELERYNSTLKQEIDGLRMELEAERTHSKAQDVELAALRSLVQGIDAIGKLDKKVDLQSAQLETLIGLLSVKAVNSDRA